jgi:arylsulfatase A
LYGDVVMEIDWSVGQILDAIRRNGLDDETLVVFTSDNGPWLSYGDHAGSAGPLREGKSTAFEGGTRVPCIMRWPGKIPSGTRCDELATTMDLLPTIVRLIGAELPADRIIDGKDIRPLITAEPGAVGPHEVFFCYHNGELRAVRDCRWKLYFPHRYHSLGNWPGGRDGMPADYEQAEIGMALYDLSVDASETKNVAAEHPEIVERLSFAADRAREALGDTLTGRVGREVRPAGRLPD